MVAELIEMDGICIVDGKTWKTRIVKKGKDKISVKDMEIISYIEKQMRK